MSSSSITSSACTVKTNDSEDLQRNSIGDIVDAMKNNKCPKNISNGCGKSSEVERKDSNSNGINSVTTVSNCSSNEETAREKEFVPDTDGCCPMKKKKRACKPKKRRRRARCSKPQRGCQKPKRRRRKRRASCSKPKPSCSKPKRRRRKAKPRCPRPKRKCPRPKKPSCRPKTC